MNNSLKERGRWVVRPGAELYDPISEPEEPTCRKCPSYRKGINCSTCLSGGVWSVVEADAPVRLSV